MQAMKPNERWRAVVVAALVQWGEWEAVGYDQGLLRETALGLIAQGGLSAPSAAGPRIPLALLIPDEVAECGRIVADMRIKCRAGERYYRLIRQRYVLGEEIHGKAIERAIAWIVAAWITGDYQSLKKKLPKCRVGT